MNVSTSDFAATQRHNVKRLALWTGLWLLTMALANFGPQLWWAPHSLWTWAAIALNLLVGVGMILANKRHLMGLDEMQRLVQLEAMALTLGVGLVVGLAYSNLEVSGLITGPAQISHLVVIMALTYLVATLWGQRKLS
ncbi:hypothetical protein [Ferrimonas balearica]|uniref:hypothetical protein n=1 Tax=Ferrimonas balearica TaxID=44012 RepID=UPI001C9905F8|nr:hypothetical protein [Ferrimonas balearica]MBY5990869.1 hypothetical protein [Ferrimonas balearica]